MAFYRVRNQQSKTIIELVVVLDTDDDEEVNPVVLNEVVIEEEDVIVKMAPFNTLIVLKEDSNDFFKINGEKLLKKFVTGSMEEKASMDLLQGKLELPLNFELDKHVLIMNESMMMLHSKIHDG